jgi:hypothetical protein
LHTEVQVRCRSTERPKRLGDWPCRGTVRNDRLEDLSGRQKPPDPCRGSGAGHERSSQEQDGCRRAGWLLAFGGDRAILQNPRGPDSPGVTAKRFFERAARALRGGQSGRSRSCARRTCAHGTPRYAQPVDPEFNLTSFFNSADLNGVRFLQDDGVIRGRPVADRSRRRPSLSALVMFLITTKGG